MPGVVPARRPLLFVVRWQSTGECKGVQGVSFPAPIVAASFITGERKLNYRRGPNDRMVVPYNPWLLLYFRSHINVQVSSTTNVIYYLFSAHPYLIPHHSPYLTWHVFAWPCACLTWHVLFRFFVPA